MIDLSFAFAENDNDGYCADFDYLQILKEQLSSFGIPEMTHKEVDQFLSLLAHDLWKRPEALIVYAAKERMTIEEFFKKYQSQQVQIKEMEGKCRDANEALSMYFTLEEKVKELEADKKVLTGQLEGKNDIIKELEDEILSSDKAYDNLIKMNTENANNVDKLQAQIAEAKILLEDGVVLFNRGMKQAGIERCDKALTELKKD